MLYTILYFFAELSEYTELFTGPLDTIALILFTVSVLRTVTGQIPEQVTEEELGRRLS